MSSLTVPVAGDGVALLYGAIVLLVLSWTTFSMRVGVRVWRKAWGMDDWFMLVGMVFKLPMLQSTKGLIFSSSFSSQLQLLCASSAVTMDLVSSLKMYRPSRWQKESKYVHPHQHPTTLE
jgi:hypothetical protein